jgi:hypothetical protein
MAYSAVYIVDVAAPQQKVFDYVAKARVQKNYNGALANLKTKLESGS